MDGHAPRVTSLQAFFSPPVMRAASLDELGADGSMVNIECRSLHTRTNGERRATWKRVSDGNKSGPCASGFA